MLQSNLNSHLTWYYCLVYILYIIIWNARLFCFKILNLCKLPYKFFYDFCAGLTRSPYNNVQKTIKGREALPLSNPTKGREIVIGQESRYASCNQIIRDMKNRVRRYDSSSILYWLNYVSDTKKAPSEIKADNMMTFSIDLDLNHVQWRVQVSERDRSNPVSYTHQTLPTICSV